MSFGIKNMFINSVKEKMRVGASAYGILNDTRTMLKEMVSNMQEKLKKKIGSSEDNMMMMMNNRRAKMMKDGGGDETMVRIKNLEENIKELVTTVERIGRSIASPPDVELRIRTTREMLQRNAPYFVMGLILVFSLWFCCRCFRYCCRMKTVKMMKAPGRNFRMPRPNFEANPRSYFRNLHTSVKPKFG